MSSALTVLHLYPRELGINGDVGNVTALVKRAAWRGIDITVLEHGIGDVLPADVDLIHIGSGPVSGQRAVYDDLGRIGDRLRAFADEGVPILAIAGGWQLLGSELVTHTGEFFSGARIFPSKASLQAERTVGEVVVRSADGIVAGFENHSAITVLDAGAVPFGTVVASETASHSGMRADGIRFGESIGTNLHGPLLPLNPVLADRLLGAALTRAGAAPAFHETSETRTVDGYADRAREAIMARLGFRDDS